MFEDKFIATLPEDNTEAGMQVCEKFFEVHNSLRNAKKQQAKIELYLRALAFADIFINTRKINYGPIPTIDCTTEDARANTIKRVCDFFAEWQKETEKLMQRRNMETAYEAAKESYALLLGKSVAYEFSDENFKKVQGLLKGIIEELGNIAVFEKEYKTRLTCKFQKLEEKLSPKMCHFDGFWGVMIDMWVALGKNCSAAKPLAQQAQEIADIIWDIQATSENVKNISPVHLLPESKITTHNKAKPIKK